MMDTRTHLWIADQVRNDDAYERLHQVQNDEVMVRE